MQTRLDYGKAAPGAVQAMYKLQKYVEESGWEHSLLELVKARVSQMNGCAFCIDMHTKDARAAGEIEQRLYGLSAWREAPYYSERERAALAWAEVVTNIWQTHVSDEESESVARSSARRSWSSSRWPSSPSTAGTGSPSPSGRRSGSTNRERKWSSR
jgi:AhpD family alkylhydroperoxidase